jgi:hypothetical protein
VEAAFASHSGLIAEASAPRGKERYAVSTDRDESIDQLLHRTRFAGPASDTGCPDAELLAALADGTLSPSVSREIEAHLADCDRCQMTAAAMVRAEGPAAATETAGDVPAWRRRAFNWLVPAAAAATALALWVLLPGQSTSLPEPPTRDQETAAIPAPLEPEAVITEPLRLPADTVAQSEAADREEKVAVQPAPRSAAPAPPAGVAGGTGSLQETVAVRDQAAGSTVGNQITAEQSGDRQVRSGGLPAAVEAAPPPAAAVPPPAAARVAQAPPAPAAVLRAAPAPRFDVSSAAQGIRWRIGPNALVQYSADGGLTWIPRPTRIPAEFAAGSAPTNDVLWLVGRGGVIVRTTDAGREWQQMDFPETGDLIAVTASSALDAIVQVADGRRLRTTDGGRTWASAP